MKVRAKTALLQDEKLVYHAGEAQRFRSENPIGGQFPGANAVDLMNSESASHGQEARNALQLTLENREMNDALSGLSRIIGN